MATEMMIVTLPTDDNAMHAAIDEASIADLAPWLFEELEYEESIADVASAGGFPVAEDYLDVEHLERVLRKHPRAVEALRRYLHEAIDDGPGRAGCQTRIGGVDVIIAGGITWGGEPYEGFSAHCVLERFLDRVGAGVPVEAPPRPDA
ncbi:hypothetical protein [Gordonia alkanivorans]|uniref:hypothetical protein n=1 Tax=Gordonia alkanivorans TaxID=84096 RepID=UPI0004AD87E0|nr:hypothetical protein [Gordonia alkanivorans]